MKKILLLSFIGFFVFSLNFSFGQGVSLSDLLAQTLSAGEPSVLPNSPFYFLKELGRNVKKAFIFDDVKKIDFELKILDEKLLEAKKLVENNPEKVNVLKRALENYKQQALVLKNKLEVIKEKTNNENLEKIIENILNRTIKHQIIIEDIISKIEERAKLNLKQDIDELKTRNEEVLKDVSLKIKSQEKLPEILNRVVENQLQEQKNNPALAVKVFSLVNDIEEKIPVESVAVGQKLEDIKLKVVNRGIVSPLKEVINQTNTLTSTPRVSEERVNNQKSILEMTINEILEKMPREKRLKVLEEIKQIIQNRVNVNQVEEVKLDKPELTTPNLKEKKALDKDLILNKIDQIQKKALDRDVKAPVETFTVETPALDKEKPNPLTKPDQVKKDKLDIDNEREGDVKYIIVTQPSSQSEQHYTPGTRMEIKWRSLNVKKVKVYLCDTKNNSCNLFGGIPNEGIVNNGFFKVYLEPNHPYFPLESGRIKVVDASNPEIYGFSGYFSVYGPGDFGGGNKDLKLVFPNTEQNLIAGTYLDLKWTSSNVKRVKIYLCEVNLNSSATNREKCKLVVPESGIANTNSYRLYLDPNHPYIPLELGMIKIVDADNESIFVNTPNIKVSLLKEGDVKDERMTTTYPNVNKPFEKRPDFISE